MKDIGKMRKLLSKMHGDRIDAVHAIDDRDRVQLVFYLRQLELSNLDIRALLRDDDDEAE